VCSRHIIKWRGHSSAVNTPCPHPAQLTYLITALIIFLCGSNFAVIGALEYCRGFVCPGSAGHRGECVTFARIVLCRGIVMHRIVARMPFLTNIIHKDTYTQSGAEIGMRFHYLKSCLPLALPHWPGDLSTVVKRAPINIMSSGMNEGESRLLDCTRATFEL